MRLRKTSVVCGVLAVLFAVILGLLCVRYRQLIIEKSVAETEQKLVSSAIHIEGLIREIETIAVNIEEQVKLCLNNPDMMSELYESILMQNRKLRGIGVGYEYGYMEGHDVCLLYAMYDKSGNVFTEFYGDDNYCVFHEMEWYAKPKNERRPIWIDPYNSEINKTQVLTYSYPLYDSDGYLMGVLALDLHSADITEFMQSEYFDFDRMLIGRTGEIIYSTECDMDDKKTLFDKAFEESDVMVSLHAGNMCRGESGRGRVMWKGVESVLMYKSLAHLGWSVGVLISVEEMYAGVDFVMKIQVLAIIAFLTFLLMIVIFIRSLGKTNKELVVARQRAEQADKMKSLFLANMSHEIRTPLNAIVGFADLLAQEGSNMTEGEKKELVGMIFKNNELLLTLVNDILDLSKIESGSYQMKREPLEINAVCDFAVKSLLLRATDGVKLFFERTLQDTYVVGDAERIGQVLMQLIGNACKHTHEGEIKVTCVDEGKNVKILVTDTGDGISPKDLPCVFERFYKGETSASGTGLGLPISQKLVDLWGGQIGVESEYGKGSIFWFTINK